eukprot:CAMPEP_0203014182 /NCGR_PEP_ID=MMETSP1401-20130829/16307_1 /ASSEMBLY_ACC=CAM_ASM_000894 /TAXON_ID=38833 /ORGANISM="Micromonas pusilla, Strain CCAC1681" /LENGTH=45 /DNA_ID= /DNA_START= /DNA_END= /DNA_ORIENTATION=
MAEGDGKLEFIADKLATAFDVPPVAAMEKLLDLQPAVLSFFEADG